MADNSNDNILGSLKGLIWSVFVGVVSFQVLAPIVWDYLHSALGVRPYCSYWLFTGAYFLILPAFIFGWLIGKRKLIAKYLPVYNGDLTVASKYFLNGVIIFVALQFTIEIIGFFYRWPNPLFYFVLGIYALCCAVFLIACYFFCQQHISHVFGVQGVVSGDKENTSSVSKSIKYFRQLFLPAVFVYFLLFLVALLFINHWREQNNKRDKYSRNNSAHEAGKRSFAFQELNNFVNYKSGKLAYIEDTAQEIYIKVRLDSAIYQKDFMPNDRSDTIVNQELRKYLDSLQGWTKELGMLLNQLKDSTKPTSAFIKSFQDTARFNIPDSIFTKTFATKADLHLVGLLRIYLGATSNKITKVAKSEMGIQLRAVQTKGMLMLISLFFTLLALYIFIKIINKTQALDLELIQTKQKIERSSDGSQIQEEAERKIAESGKTVNDLWLMITVAAWLLVPIFKLVKDEEINLSNPYKTPTFARSDGGQSSKESDPNNTSPSRKRDTLFIHNRFDAINVQLIDTGDKNMQPDSVLKLLKEIQDRVNNVQTDVKNVQSQLRQ